VTRRGRGAARAGLVVATVAVLSGCGLGIQSADLFLLKRTGEGSTLTVVVNNSGTISCNRAPSKQISDSMLISARDLSDSLVNDAGKGLTIQRVPGTVYYYRISMQQGTVSFPDRAAAAHSELAQAELFATQAASGPCKAQG
jgi:hypothetical protein